MSEPETLTGKVRHRSGWFGRLVLQVEVMGRPYCQDGGGCFGPVYLRWRDARTTDLEEAVRARKLALKNRL